MKGVNDTKLYLEKLDSMSKVTKKVIDNFNRMGEDEFRVMYQCSKLKYFKRVMKYGDPYMNAPLAKIGKFLIKHKWFTN